MKGLIIILLLIPFTFALDVSFDETIYSGEEFEVHIQGNESVVYDIKIDILMNGSRISKIYKDDKWASTMYYISSGFSGDEEYKLITSGTGEAELIVKLRDSNGKVQSFGPYNITISDEKGSEESEYDDEENIIREEKITNFSKENVIVEKDIIHLNPKTIKTEKSNVVLGKGIIKYSLAVFCFILFLLYIKKPEKKENEFRRDYQTKDYSINGNRSYGEAEGTFN